MAEVYKGDRMNLMVKNIATKEEWDRFLVKISELNKDRKPGEDKMTISKFFREIVKGAIDDHEE